MRTPQQLVDDLEKLQWRRQTARRIMDEKGHVVAVEELDADVQLLDEAIIFVKDSFDREVDER